MNVQPTKIRSRAGGRTARRTLRSTCDIAMLPGLTSHPPVCEVMDGAHVEKIDNASMDILENVGVIFRDETALEDWRHVGAKVVEKRVYLDRGLVQELMYHRYLHIYKRDCLELVRKRQQDRHRLA